MLDALSSFAAHLRQSLEGPQAIPEPGAWATAFPPLALQLFRLQHATNADYRRLCEARGVSAAAIAHWWEVPAVPTSAFKQSGFSCLPEDRQTAVFESSGTTAGARSRHCHSAESLALYEAALWAWGRAHLLPDDTAAPCRFLSLTPPAAMAPRSSLVHMLECVARRGHFERRTFAGFNDAAGRWQVAQEEALSFLQQAVQDGAPVMLAGTAFNFVQWLDSLSAGGISLVLPAGSRVMETGGYKGLTRSLTKPDLHAWISTTLSVPARFLVTEYGMTELSSQGYDRVADGRDDTRRLRFPPWTRTMVISPETGMEAGVGEPGLLRIHDLANVFSVCAIETEDLAVLDHDGLHLLGRDPQAEPRGCSLRSLPQLPGEFAA